MEWLDKQALLDGVEKELLKLYKVRREYKGMKKARETLQATRSTNSTILPQLLERYI